MTQQRSEETREKLLGAAEKLFAREGYDATGVAEICKEAGVSKGAFYHHFESKQLLFLQLLSRWLARLDDQMERLRAHSQGADHALVNMAAVTSTVFADAQGQLPIFLDFWAKAARDPLVWTTVPAEFSRYRSFFADIIQQGVDEGSLRPVDPQAAARLIIALAIGLLVQGLISPQDTDWGKAVQDGVSILLTGIQETTKV